MRRLLTPVLACALACTLAACQPEPKLTPAKTEKAPVAHDHSAAAKHGGTVVEVGDHAALMEVVRDEAAGVVSVWIYDMDGAALAPDEPPVLNVPGDEPKQLTGIDEAGAWTFRDDVLAAHVHGARFRIALGGTSHSPALPDQH